MDQEELRAYLLSKPGAVEEYPFGPDSFVAKVGGKIFGLLALDESPNRISLKSTPTEYALLLEQYPVIKPAPYLARNHWVAVPVGTGDLPDDLLPDLVDESYSLVRSKLTRKVRDTLPPLDPD